MSSLILSAPRRIPNNASIVSIGSPLPAPSQLKVGWTVTHQESNSDITSSPSGGTKQMLGDTSLTGNQHLVGFATPSVNPSNNSTPPLLDNRSMLDERFGVTQATGWFSQLPANELTLTACGCPPWMRVDPAGTYLNTGGQWPLGVPTSTELTSLGEYQPPWISHNVDYANLIVEVLIAYPHIKYVQVWNEYKGFYSNSLTDGNGNAGRWWHEGYTNLYNAVWTAIQNAKTALTVRSDIKVIGPYMVFRTQSWSTKSDWATGATEPNGPWGYAGDKVLASHQYWNANALGADYVSFDVRNNTSDFERSDYMLTAKCNTTIGSTTITSPEGPIRVLPNQFDAVDVGKYIRGQGIPAGATILTRTNTPIPTITISAPATETHSGSDTVPLTFGAFLTKTITDGVIGGTGGDLNKILTSASGPFTTPPSPEGKNIEGTGVPRGTKIAGNTGNPATTGRISNTQVRLSVACTPGAVATATFGEWPFETAYTWTDDPWNSSELIHDILDWFQLQGGLLATKPVWINEWYANPLHWLDLLGTGEAVAGEQETLSVIAWCLIVYMLAGISGLLFWRPQSEGATLRANPLGLWLESSHTATSLHPFLKFVKDHFSDGVQLYECISSDAEIKATASGTHVIVVSKSSESKTVIVQGVSVTVPPYGVRLLIR